MLRAKPFSLKEQKATVQRRAIKQPITLLVIAVVAAGLLAACNRAGGESSNGAVAATVNSKNIMLSEVDRLINLQLQGQSNQMSELQRAQARLQVLDGLIQDEVLFQRADKEKLLPSEDEVTQFINAQKQQSGMTDEDFQKKLKEQNQTAESLREDVRKNLAIQKLHDKAGAKLTVKDEEVTDFYKNNPAQFVSARGVELASIVVDPADNGVANDAKGDPEATAKINTLYQRLKSGADFATVAREQSEDPNTSLRGGDNGFATEEDLKQVGFTPELIGQFFGSMQVGDVTAPVKFGNGRHYIFKLQRKQLQNENLTLDSPGVRQQITQALLNQRKQVLNQALLEVAMYDAKIVNNLATGMINNPNSMSGLRPAQPAGAPAVPPKANGTSPSATSAANAAASPRSAASPKP
ncbi:MAG: SurA N-terminal domain-containing protein [Pyrinomonadaceae bacterium]